MHTEWNGSSCQFHFSFKWLHWELCGNGDNNKKDGRNVNKKSNQVGRVGECVNRSHQRNKHPLSVVSQNQHRRRCWWCLQYSLIKRKKERIESVSKAHTMLIINHQKANKIIRFRSFFVFGILSTKKWKDGGRNMKRKKEKRRIVILTDLNNVNSSSIKAKPTVWWQRSKPFLKVNAQRSGLKVKKSWEKYEVK